MSGDHCLMRKEDDGTLVAIHYDCDDYPDGTRTNIMTSEVIR